MELLSPVHPAQGRSPNLSCVPLQESLEDGAGSCLQPRPRCPGRSLRPTVHDEFLIVSSNNETSCSELGGSTKPDAGEQGPLPAEQEQGDAEHSLPRAGGLGRFRHPLPTTPST